MFLFNLSFMIIIAIVSSTHLPKGLISHPETGLFFQHIGRLAPNERVMNLSMIIPITLSGCYLVPLGIAQSMPACSYLFQWPHSTVRPTRFKRDPFGWIMGGGALIVGALNTASIIDLRSDIVSEANKLRDLQSQVKVYGTTLITIRDSAIALGQELKETQNLLTDQSKAVVRLETNDAALNESIAYLAREQQKLHLRHENSLLYQSLMEMYEDRPSLLFLAQSDLHFVIASIFQEAKLNYTTLYGHLPIIEAIRMLLTLQAISFHPSTTYNTSIPDEIGRFIITNYFALPQPDVYYNVFRLTTVPFFDKGIFIKLGRIPLYIAQHINNNYTIEWNSDETHLCRFGTVTVCKDIPSIGNGVTTSRRVEEILNNGNLSTCRYEFVPSAHSFRVKLMDSWWAISSESNITCLKQPLVPTVLMSEHQSVRNTRFTLPAVSIVHIERGTVLSCDDFQLIDKSTVVTNNITIFINNSFSNQIDGVFDIQKQLQEAEARHPRLPVLPSSNVDKIIAVLEGTKIRSFSNLDVQALKDSPWIVSIVSIIIILTCLIAICCFLKGWIRCPLMKILTTSKPQILTMQRSNKKQDINLHQYYQQQLRRKQQETVDIEH